MARYVIRTPNPAFNGERAGIPFTDGTAHTDDPAAAEFCRYLGYDVQVAAEEPTDKKRKRDAADG